MSAFRLRALAVAVLAGGVPAAAQVAAAADEAPDDADLLEFIGSWEGEDDEWLEVFDARNGGAAEERDGEQEDGQSDEDDEIQ